MVATIRALTGLQRKCLATFRAPRSPSRILVAEGYLAGDPETSGKIFWATAHGLVMLHLTVRLDPKPDFATLHQTAMRMLAKGAGASGASVPRAKRRAS
jgi:hypothetical protein